MRHHVCANAYTRRCLGGTGMDENTYCTLISPRRGAVHAREGEDI